MFGIWQQQLGIDLCEIFDALIHNPEVLVFLFCFEGRGRRVLYFSPRNPETQGEDEQRGQEEKEEIQNKMCINVNKPFLSLWTPKKKKKKEKSSTTAFCTLH